MGEWCIILNNFDSKFGFLLDAKGLLATIDETNIRERCIAIGSFYDVGLDSLELFHEIVDGKVLLKT